MPNTLEKVLKVNKNENFAAKIWYNIRVEIRNSDQTEACQEWS